MFASATPSSHTAAIEGLDYGTIDSAALRCHMHAMGRRLNRLGIRRSDTVAICLPEGVESVVAILGVINAACCAPLNPADNRLGFERNLRALKAAAIVVEQGRTGPAIEAAGALGIPLIEIPTGPGEFAAWSDVDAAENSPEAPPPSADDVALLLFTSGTSARPKLVPLTHGNISAATTNIIFVLELTSADRCLAAMPLFHIHGLSTLFATLKSGGTFIAQPAFTANGFYRALKSSKPTWYSASPTVHRLVLQSLKDDQSARNSGLRFIRSASAPMPAPLIAQIEKTFGVGLIEAYGMTEAAPQIASNRLPPAKRKPGSVGKPAGTEVVIIDDAGHPLPQGKVGEIAVRGANVMAGYIDDPAANAAAFSNGFLRTGDLGRLDADGDLFITGRSKDIINRGGEKISPRKIDDVLLQHPAIAEAAVFAVPHSVLGEDIAAAVVLKKDVTANRQSRLADIRRFASQTLAAFEVPQQIVFVDAIPLSASGKLVRQNLASLLKPANERPAPTHAEAKTSTEICIADALADVLQTDRPGLHDNFFGLGGHSLAAMRVISRLREIFAISLSPDLLFRHPTVAELAAVIGQKLADAKAEGMLHQNADAAKSSAVTQIIPRQTGTASHRLSLAQQRLFFIDQLGAGTAYTMSANLRLRGPLDRDALHRALNEIVRRHESLRTTFALEGEIPIARIHPARAVALPLIRLNETDAEAAEVELKKIADTAAAAPFDLAAGPVFRVSLVEIGLHDHVLLMQMHHIVSDGWSVGVIHRELRTLYLDFTSGRDASLSELPIGYADYARWDVQRWEANAVDDIRYWVDELKGAAAVCTFPPDHPRPPTQRHRGATHRTRIDRPTLDGLTSLGQSYGATPFMVFLAAFQTLLYRHNGQADCVVGIPIANRMRPEFEPIVGFFANTLLMRTQLNDDVSFTDLLARVRRSVTDGFAHGDVPLEKVLEALKAPRESSHSPLFQVMFAFQNFADAGDGGAESGAIDFTETLRAMPFASDSHAAKFDLTLYLTEDSDGLSARWQYDSDLYEASTVVRLAEQYDALLRGIAGEAGRSVAKLPLLSSAQKSLIETTWNRTAKTREKSGHFLELFDAQVRNRPADIAAICGEASASYASLNRRANGIASHLAGLGVKPGTIVGVCLQRSIDLIAAILGIWKTGGGYLAVDSEHPSARIEHLLADARVDIVLADGSTHARVDPGRDATAYARRIVIVGDIPELTGHVATILPALADKPAYVVYTSGSTGAPKGVVISHANVCHYAQSIVEAIGLEPSDRYLHTASFSFSSSVRQFVAPLSCGAAVVVCPSDAVRDPHQLFRIAKAQRASVIDLVPSVWSSALQLLRAMDNPKRADLLDNALRLALSASEPLPARIALAWHGMLGPRVRQINMFGQTETTGIVSTHVLDDRDRAAAGIVALGRPIANTRLYVLDSGLQVQPVGVVGEIYVGGAGVGQGYLNQPELTDRHFVPDPFHSGERLFRTGDRGKFTDDGVLQIIGRSDGQIKVRGFRIEPGEIERAIAEHPGVRECAVIASTDNAVVADGAPTRLLAFIAPAGVSIVAVRDFLRQRLPEYMVPQTIGTVEALPRTISGKIERQKLRAAAATAETERIEAFDGANARRPDQAVTESVLIDVWKQVLGLPRVGLDENFFDLGGNSLLSINVVVRAKQAGVEVSLQQLYQNQTIGQLARAITQGNDRGPNCAAVLQAPAVPSPTSDTQHEASVLLTIESLRAYGFEALTRAGLDSEGARVVTEVQLEASMRGQPTHDMVSIPRYAKRLSTGKINARPNIRVEHETPVSARIDGDNGPGQWVSTVAMQHAIKKALAHGVGMVAVRRSNHFGAAAQYVWHATQKGLIGLCTTNGPLILAPTGGVRPTFGNNPIGVGIPSASHFPILLDIAMSVAPRGKIGLAVAEGKPLPPNWILDSRGRPSTDLADLAAGLGVPIGGHKGYGLALVMEILAGVISGAGFGADHHRDALKNATAPDFGHFFMAIDPKMFTDAAAFLARVDHLIEQTKTGPLAEGSTEILIPGEFEMRARDRSMREGVRLRRSTYESLLTYASDADLATQLQVIDAPAGTATSVPSAENTIPFDRSEFELGIVARFASVVRQQPNELALCDAKIGLTYEALDRLTDRMARGMLHHTHGRDGPVAYLVQHSVDMVLCALAAIKAARPFLCIHPALPAAAQRQIIEDAAPALLLFGAESATNAAGICEGICPAESIEAIKSNPFSGELPIATAQTPAVIFYTSGSTGKPKGVVKNHRAILHRAWLSAQHDGIRPGDRQSLLTHCSFASSEADVFGALLNGATLDLYDSATLGIDRFGQWIADRGITVLHPPVVMFRRFLSTLNTTHAFPGVRLVALAGEAVLPADIFQWQKHFSPTCTLRHRFSSTEAGHIAVALINAGDVFNGALPPATPVADKHLMIVDEAGQPTAPGEAGELIVRSAYLADGYWRRPEKTAEDFIVDPLRPGERYFRTGDIGRLLADGRFEFIGRRDNQTKIRGYRVELREIEQAIAQMPGVKEAAVVVQSRNGENDLGENALIAFIVHNAGPAAVAQLRRGLALQLPAWKVPAEFRAIQTLPLTFTGKIDRQALADLAKMPNADAEVRKDSFLQTDATADALYSIWCTLLRRNDIGPDDDFFDAGGHSLLAAQLIQKINQRFGSDLPLARLATAPTIRLLAGALRGDPASSLAPNVATVVLLNAGSADRVPLFCLPPAQGTAVTYLPLARSLGDQPVYAVLFPHDDADASIEAIAARMLQDIRAIVPNGPVSLCGHSYGGVLAFEIARQMRLANQPVRLLALLDTRVPGDRQQRALHERLRRHAGDIAARGARGGAAHLMQRLRQRFAAKRIKPSPAHDAPQSPADGLQADRAARRTASFRAYRPGAYAGTITLIKAEVEPEWAEFLKVEPANGWDAVCDDIRIRAIPCDHLGMLQEPNLAHLGVVLRELLKAD